MTIYGLIGYPVKHSLSAVMHNAAFRYLNLKAEYHLFEVESSVLAAFILENIAVKDISGEVFQTKDIAGFNITIPHKIKAKEIVEQEFPFDPNALWDEQDFYVQFSGAVNTVKRGGIALEYYNTDAVGFARSIKEDLGIDLSGAIITIAGCGGAARAIIACACAITKNTPNIFIWDARQEVLEAARSHINIYLHKFPHLAEKIVFIKEQEQIAQAIDRSTIFVNATPLGMEENNALIIGKEILHKNLAVYDLVYNRQTELIKNAKSLGLSACGGLGMLLHQGAAAFEIWTGKKAPVEIMREALRKEMKA